MPVTHIARARKCGHVRFHMIYDYPLDLNGILVMSYLKPEADKLLEIGRAEAVQVLVCWLHRDAAYQTELMPAELAEGFAENFVREHSDETSRFFTNGHWNDGNQPQDWIPLTDSIFDGGVLIQSGRGNDTRHTCLWFEDED